MTTGKEKKLFRLIEDFEGDRVIWMIVLLLMLISIVTVFTSTPLLANQQHTTRFDIIRGHLLIVGLGLAVIVLLYNIKNIKFFKFLSQFGFGLSLLLLLYLTFHIGAVPGDPNAGWPIRAATVNDSWRIIKVFSLQLHVYEVVKVAMVMYLAWAVNAMKDEEAVQEQNKDFALLRWLKRTFPNQAWLAKPITEKCLYIYSPIVIVSIFMLDGGTSATLLFLMLMFLILFVGGVNMGEIIGLGSIVAIILGLGIALGMFDRFKNVNWETRTGSLKDKLEKVEEAKPAERRNVIDGMKLEQPVGAMIAIQEGGILGKGIGRSDQKYKVAVIFEDYIFSFIIEETGLWGALIIMILYLSLLARGSRVALKCDDYFAKFALGGLVVLISIQAFMHMAINVHLLPQTGQTLPMISHGASSFLCFCVAFGIILSISRMAHTEMLKETSMANPLVVKDDEVQSGLNELDTLESEDYN